MILQRRLSAIREISRRISRSLRGNRNISKGIWKEFGSLGAITLKWKAEIALTAFNGYGGIISSPLFRGRKNWNGVYENLRGTNISFRVINPPWTRWRMKETTQRERERERESSKKIEFEISLESPANEFRVSLIDCLLLARCFPFIGEMLLRLNVSSRSRSVQFPIFEISKFWFACVISEFGIAIQSLERARLKSAI